MSDLLQMGGHNLYIFQIGNQSVQIDFEELRLKRDGEQGAGRPVLRALGEGKMVQYDLIKQHRFLPGTAERPHWYFMYGEGGPIAFLPDVNAAIERAYQLWCRNWLLNGQAELATEDKSLAFTADFRKHRAHHHKSGRYGYASIAFHSSSSCRCATARC